MKNQALFSSKDKSQKLKCCLLQFLIGTLKVKCLFFAFSGRGEGGNYGTFIKQFLALQCV